MEKQTVEPENKQANRIINKILNKEKIKCGIKNFLKKIAQEGREYKEMTQILHGFIKTGKGEGRNPDSLGVAGKKVD